MNTLTMLESPANAVEQQFRSGSVSPNPRPTVICLTPVKNEACNLHRFLKCASLWADHIIIADQGSDDGSREIAQSYPKVTLLENSSPVFDEATRQRLLIDAARRIPGPRLLIALDADEVLTANVLRSPEWSTVLQAAAGTLVCFRWPVVCSDMRSYWTPRGDQRFGFTDNGAEHVGEKIHSPRIPVPQQAPQLILQDIRVMHYVGADPERWESKHRWYQCWERLNRPQARAIGIYRRYHRKDVVPAEEVRPIPDDWVQAYEAHDIDMTSVQRQAVFQWDKEVLRWMVEHGPARFRREAIWDVDWTELYRRIYGVAPPVSLRDPRSLFDKLVHGWLAWTQPHFSYFRSPRLTHSHSAVGVLSLSYAAVRVQEKLLELLGWF